MKRYLLLIAGIPVSLAAFSQENEDSVKTRQLEEFVVQGESQRTSSTVSTYIPTSKQKTAAQTGIELVNRMGIPQLRMSMGDTGGLKTASGQDVDIFIDFQPATQEDLSGMRTGDVKKVEYYDYPTDPRFMGKAHVVNFIMQKYEYGGYLKAYLSEFFIANSGQLNLYSKLQYKKMTYDIAVGGYYNSMPHNYVNTKEIYRLPQADGTIKEFERISESTDSKYRRRYAWPTFKALYSTDKITIRNTIGTNFDHLPLRLNSGTVSYIPSDFENSTFKTKESSGVNSVTYNGNWSFILPKNNSLQIVPYYSYSHTNRRYSYAESGTEAIENIAKDDSHNVSTNISFVHSFGKAGTLTAKMEGSYSLSNTHYSGTTEAFNRTKNLFLEPLVSYSVSTKKIYARLTLGWSYNRLWSGEHIDNSHSPAFGVSVQYSPNSKHSIDGHFGYDLAGFTGGSGTAVIKENPLMSYTGNPNLTSAKSYSGNFSYTWLPCNKFNLSVWGNIWGVGNRAAYNYEASADGILRTIIQPAGKYVQGSWGVYGVMRLIGGNLQLTAGLSQQIAHNGYPYGWTKSHLNYSIQAAYYHGNWNFGGYFVSDNAYSDGYMVGQWVNDGNYAAVWAGWANSKWNLKCLLANPYRWHWREKRSAMRSEYYDQYSSTYSSAAHCFVQLSATYTFGFGKKVQVGDEAQQLTGTGSGILK